MIDTTSAAFLNAKDERFTTEQNIALMTFLTPMQRGTGWMATLTPNRKNGDVVDALLRAEGYGLVRVTRSGKDTLFEITDKGKAYVERYRRHWRGLGLKESGKGGKLVPMPWPGLPQPYQPDPQR
jgi:hypothetical protein